MTLLNEYDDSKVESCCVTSDARHPRVFLRKIIIIIKKKNILLPMARLSPFLPFGVVLALQAWLWPFWTVFGPSDTLYNLTICEKDVICVQSPNC